MSEIVDSGHKDSNFSQTFNRLSHYLKENGSLGDFTLLGGARPKETTSESGGQMTIFYAGRVMVVDDFPADKATEIMMLADWIRKHSAGSNTVSVSDLPMARKASLARFLEKRKERITARAAAGENQCPSQQQTTDLPNNNTN